MSGNQEDCLTHINLRVEFLELWVEDGRRWKIASFLPGRKMNARLLKNKKSGDVHRGKRSIGIEEQCIQEAKRGAEKREESERFVLQKTAGWLLVSMIPSSYEGRD